MPGNRRRGLGRIPGLAAALIYCCLGIPLCGDAPDRQPPVELRAWGVPRIIGAGPAAETQLAVLNAFRREHPWIHPVSATGLQIYGSPRAQDMAPLMQIAGDIAPDVLHVDFRRSQTYVEKKLLYPLDRYVEGMLGVSLPDGSALATPRYLEELMAGSQAGRPNSTWTLVSDRVPRQCWDVMRRRCPFGQDCPHRRQWGLGPLAEHYHVWIFPVGPRVMGLLCNISLFMEHLDEGLELRGPRDWEEFIRWAQVLTDPEKGYYGLVKWSDNPGMEYLQLLYSAGGAVVDRDASGRWYCTLDREPAVEAAYFYARLALEKIYRDGRAYRGVLALASGSATHIRAYGMTFSYLTDRLLQGGADPTAHFAPVPAGPGGLRRSELNADMLGIFAGLADQPRRRDAAWAYIRYLDGVEARRIRTEKLVTMGWGPFVRPALLEQFNEDGRYDGVLARVSQDTRDVFRTVFEGGVPEPYGENCQVVYDMLRRPLDAILRNETVRDAVDHRDPSAGKAEIRRILNQATAQINQKMLGILPPDVERQRGIVSWAVIAAVAVGFVLLFRVVFRAFSRPEAARDAARGGARQLWRYRWAYVLTVPALLSIALWMYWPLVRGSVIAFQDYSVMGDSEWVGAGNFAVVLFDETFWYALWISLKYTLLFLVFGFCSPIALAFLLQMVPRGSIVFRTVYYLPTILTGVVVIFLWKSFYQSDGLINEISNGFIRLFNKLPGVDIPARTGDLLDNRSLALLLCLLPTAWAGMGPGCLIYLAALKTIPEEIYEAADIDGAGLRIKIFHIAIPSIKALVMINFIGAMIGAFRGAGDFVLAMTGGGPYDMRGGATEVIGLKIFYTTFGHLDFGVAASMAWVLGSLLIGFTVVQLRSLSRLEFRTLERRE